MPIVRMPDGTQVSFPDDMPSEQIRGLIASRFPDVATSGQQPPAVEPLSALQQVGSIDAQSQAMPNGTPQGVPQQVVAQEAEPAPAEGQSILGQVGDALTSRSALEAIGATTGSLIPYLGQGGVAAGAARGAQAGGALGAIGGWRGRALGSLVGGIAGAIAGNSVRDIIAPEEAPQNIEQLTDRLRGASQDEVTSQVISAAIPVVAKPFRSAATSFMDAGSGAAQELYKKAQQFGIDLAPANLRDSSFVDSWRKVIGVMPWAGKPFIRSSERQREQVAGAVDDILDTIAPNTNMFDSGVNLIRAAENASEAFTKEAKRYYKNFYDKAAQLPAAFKSDAVKNAANDILSRRAVSQIEGVTSPVSDNATELLTQLGSMPDHLSIQQIRGMTSDLNSIIATRKMAGEDVTDLLSIKKAFEKASGDIDTSIVGDAAAKEVTGALKAANKFYAENIKKFQTATGKKFGRVDKNIFNVGFSKAGTRPDDQTMKAVFDAGSPKALQELRNIVGEKPFASAVRAHLQEPMRSIVKEVDGVKYVDSSDFVKRFKLDTDEGRKTMQEMLKGSGIDRRTVDSFIDVVRSVERIQPTSPSSFLQRRLTLGGLGAFGSFYGVGMVPAASILYLTGKVSDAFTNPKVMRDFVRANNAAIPDRLKIAALERMVGALYGDKEAEEVKKNRQQLISE